MRIDYLPDFRAYKLIDIPIPEDDIDKLGKGAEFGLSFESCEVGIWIAYKFYALLIGPKEIGTYSFSTDQIIVSVKKTKFKKILKGEILGRPKFKKFMEIFFKSLKIRGQNEDRKSI
jgi:hypothetical protein